MIELVAQPDPPEIEELMLKFSGELVFDVGANVGQSAEKFAATFGRVVSLEPAVESFELLQTAVAELPNVVALNMAAGREIGELELTVQSAHIARGQLTSYRGGDDGHAWGRVEGFRTVRCTTIDELSVAYGPPDLIKCDVEGGEVEVFRGGLTTVKLHRPDLFVEVHEASLGAELIKMLTPFYGDALKQVFHPHYGPHDWGRANHWWLCVGESF